MTCWYISMNRKKIYVGSQMPLILKKDWDWCVSHNTEGAELENASDHMAQLAVQGRKRFLLCRN